jgi:hypothetical protein
LDIESTLPLSQAPTARSIKAQGGDRMVAGNAKRHCRILLRELREVANIDIEPWGSRPEILFPT